MKELHRWIKIPAVFLFLWCLVSPTHAFKLIPMEMKLEPSGRGVNGLFRVENDSDQDVAIQVSMAKRDVDVNGKEQHPSAEDEFTVFPTQITLGPKKSQAVRVRWMGNPKPDKELAYRIIAEQLPVNLAGRGEGGRINLVVRYVGSVYIVPKGVKPIITLDSVAQETSPGGERKLAITFYNRGTSHGFLENLRLLITSDGKSPTNSVGTNLVDSESLNAAGLNSAASTNKLPNSVHLPGEKLQVSLTENQLSGIAGENILAGNKRRFLLPWPKELKPGEVQIKFEIDLPK